MSLIFKIIITVIVASFAGTYLKSLNRDFSQVLMLSAAAVILTVLLPQIKEIKSRLIPVLPLSEISSESLLIFFKCVVVCLICSLTKSFCKDSSNQFMCSLIDLSEKISVLIISFPLIESVLTIITKLIGD